MACLELNSPQIFSTEQSYDGIFNLFTLGNTTAKDFNTQNAPKLHQLTTASIPQPPPLPAATYGAKKYSKHLNGCSFVLHETRKAWDKLFCQGYGADVRILTEDKGIILAHSGILGIASPVLRNMLEQAKIKEGFRKIKVPGVPSEAVREFIRFLYSSCYELDLLKKYVLHLLILSHAFAVPSLKRTCIELVEEEFLTVENVVDVLQLARLCDTPRLSFACTKMIIKYFKTISASDGWKAMKKANPSLEQELLVALVEEDSRKQDRIKRMEERKVYLQLYEAMDALLHICRDGCRTIGPRDKMLKDSETTCKYAACKGLESLVRHFSNCRIRVPGGCAQCKRMWQLLELHSQMCSEPDFCKVPLCRHFKDKMKHLSKKEEHKWKLLVSKVLAAKGTLSSIAARRLLVP
ncbi:BTB/POZ and TAZ domain-containing protein 3 [Canna indica]|uniref:BTB/POZ and TAZ domain-containing protein 3 n=1 Tax=Canna indica TaxID=4628 RepID=A0AAQ3Q574_9LILI|nr:BTB/POZ and TAZ domain-containing protein 3 [Canna indica]